MSLLNSSSIIHAYLCLAQDLRMKLSQLNRDRSREKIWLDLVGATKAVYNEKRSAWDADQISIGHASMPIPPTIRFNTVAFFGCGYQAIPAGCLPVISNRISGIIHRDVYTPVDIGDLELDLEDNASVDLRKLKGPADMCFFSIGSNKSLHDCYFDNVKDLTIHGTSNDVEIDLLSIHLGKNIRNISITDATVLNILDKPAFYISCWYSKSPIDLANTNIHKTSSFKNSWNDIAKPFFGTGDILGLQDALLDAGFL